MWILSFRWEPYFVKHSTKGEEDDCPCKDKCKCKKRCIVWFQNIRKPWDYFFWCNREWFWYTGDVISFVVRVKENFKGEFFENNKSLLLLFITKGCFWAWDVLRKKTKRCTYQSLRSELWVLALLLLFKEQIQSVLSKTEWVGLN